MDISTYARVPHDHRLRAVEVVETGRGEKTVYMYSIGACRYSQNNAEGVARRLEEAAAAVRRDAGLPDA